MTAQDVLENVAKGMVAAGLYKDVTTAISALALEQIERKIAHYRAECKTSRSSTVIVLRTTAVY